MLLMNNSSRFRDFGLLVIRFSAGAILAYVHGYDKITGGAGQWHDMGSSMANLGIHFAFTFWGFMSAFTEFVGGIFIALGLLFRPFTILVVINFAVAFFSMMQGETFAKASHPAELLFLFIGLLITGPGKFSGDQLIGLNK